MVEQHYHPLKGRPKGRPMMRIGGTDGTGGLGYLLCCGIVGFVPCRVLVMVTWLCGTIRTVDKDLARFSMLA